MNPELSSVIIPLLVVVKYGRMLSTRSNWQGSSRVVALKGRALIQTRGLLKRISYTRKIMLKHSLGLDGGFKPQDTIR